MSKASPPLRVIHTVALLEEPQLGTRVLALIEAGTQIVVLGHHNGFVAIIGPNGTQGFVPAAICSPLAQEQPGVFHISQPVMLYRAPLPGQQFGVVDASKNGTLTPGEALQLLARDGDMLLVQCAVGSIGYVRAADTTLPPEASDRPPQLVVIRPTQLMPISNAGRRRLMVLPEDTLLRLGRDRNFLLAQREDGRVGFVPALLGDIAPNKDRFDLTMIGLGIGWMILNWGGITMMIGQIGLVIGNLGGPIGLGLVLGLVATLWFVSPRPILARSFGVGILLVYGILHLASNGSLTLWR